MNFFLNTIIINFLLQFVSVSLPGAENQGDLYILAQAQQSSNQEAGISGLFDDEDTEKNRQLNEVERFLPTGHILLNDPITRIAKENVAKNRSKKSQEKTKQPQKEELPLRAPTNAILQLGATSAEAQNTSSGQGSVRPPVVYASPPPNPHEGSVNECRQKFDQYNDAKTSFNEACSKAGASGRDTTCKEQMQNCMKCATVGAEGEVDKKLKDTCGELEKQSTYNTRRGRNTALQQSAGQYEKYLALAGLFNGRSIEKASRPMLTYKNCPAYAAEDLKTIEDKRREDKRELDRIEREVEKLERDIAKKEEAMAKSQLNFKKHMDKQQKQFKKEIQSLMDSKTGEFETLQGVLDKITNGMQELAIEALKAEATYHDEMQKQVLERCLAQSKEKVQKERAQQLKQISTQTFQTNSLASLLKRSGVSQTQRSRQKIRSYSNDCKKSETTRLIKQRLERNFAAQKVVLQQKEAQMQKMYKETLDKIAQVQPALKQELERMQAEQMQALQEQQRNFTEQQQIEQRALALLKQQLQEKQMDLLHIESQHAYRLDLASKLQTYASNAGGQRAKSYGEALSKYRAFADAYETAKSSCYCGDEGETTYTIEGNSEQLNIAKKQMSTNCARLNDDANQFNEDSGNSKQDTAD